MAKIAVELKQALDRRAVSGAPGRTMPRALACGENWAATDVVCTSGPRDRPFEERHANFRIALVVAGSFQYRALRGPRTSRELMTPGSVLLGNPGQYFECGHEHGEGDRCVSFGYAVDSFETLAADAGFRGRSLCFDTLRLPPVREMAPLVARACAGLAGVASAAWEELSMQVAIRVVQLACGAGCEPAGARTSATPGAVRRVTDIVRTIEHHPDANLTLASLAREARLSLYHFLRVFEQVTGVTPHQYILRARLRETAMRLADEPARILDVALDSGFGDVSNFNRAFRAEFGVSPRAYRRQDRSQPSS